MLVLVVAGTAIAGYLTYVHYAGLKPICLAGGGCETVQSSRYSRLAGVPVALLGLLTYLAIGGARLTRGETAVLATAALCLIGFGFSAYLTYRELFTIHAICQWCAGSAVIMTALAILAVVDVWRTS